MYNPWAMGISRIVDVSLHQTTTSSSSTCAQLHLLQALQDGCLKEVLEPLYHALRGLSRHLQDFSEGSSPSLHHYYTSEFLYALNENDYEPLWPILYPTSLNSFANAVKASTSKNTPLPPPPLKHPRAHNPSPGVNTYPKWWSDIGVM